MPTGGQTPGPQSWGFMPTGPTKATAMAANTVTLTLGQFVSTAPYAPQAAIWNIGTDEAFIMFGTGTHAATLAVPIVPTSKMSRSGTSGGPRSGGMQVLSTGKRPQQYCVIGSAGTSTVYITPGEGHR